MDPILLEKIRKRKPLEESYATDEIGEKKKKRQKESKKDISASFTKKQPKKQHPEKNCADCGAMFQPTRKNQKYCAPCGAKNNPVYEREEGSKSYDRVCPICQAEFVAQHKNYKYCPDCSGKYTGYMLEKMGVLEAKSDNSKRVKIICVNDTGNCPNTPSRHFEATWLQYRQGRKYCCKLCRDTMMTKPENRKKHQPNLRKEVSQQVIEVNYTPFDKQMEFHNSKARFRLLCCANRWGKDRASINDFIAQFVEMLSEERSDTLVPRVMGWIVAPTYDLAKQNWRELKHFMPEEWVKGVNEAERRMETVMDGLIEVKSADNPESLVAVGLDIVLMTECARAKNLQDIWANIFARLSSDGRGLKGEGGLGIFNSTPLGLGFFHTMYSWGQDPSMPEWESWKFDCYGSPYIRPKDIEHAKRTLPERLFRQNWLADFLSSGGDVFANIDDISFGQVQEPQDGMTYFAAWDPSQRGDNSIFMMRNERGEQVYVAPNMTGQFWDDQLARIQVHCKRYNNAKLYIDMTGLGDTLPERAVRMGLDAEGVYFSGPAKENMVSKFIVLTEQKSITLLDNETQKNELKAYTYTTTRSGKISYGAPGGMHDDHVSSLIMLYRDFDSAILQIPYMGMISSIKHKRAI